MGPTELCINISQQTWAFILPPEKDFWTLLRLFTDLSFYENHVNTTETLGKGKKKHYAKGLLIRTFSLQGTGMQKQEVKKHLEKQADLALEYGMKQGKD